jgi:hypothetical protein
MENHWIFFVYTFLNTVSRVVARQISVRLERKMYGGQKVVSGEVMQDESQGEVQDAEDEPAQEESGDIQT